MVCETIIFVPGFMCDSRLFQPQIDVFERLGINCQSFDDITGGTIREMAFNVLANAPDRFVLSGLSMGGIIALEIYKQAPERVSHLALLNTTPFADRSQDQRQIHIKRVNDGQMQSVISQELKAQISISCNITPGYSGSYTGYGGSFRL